MLPQSSCLVHFALSSYVVGHAICGLLPFGHRTISHFVQDKARDGTLSELAGQDFSPHTASLYAYLEISKCASDVFNFGQFFQFALSRAMGNKNAVLFPKVDTSHMKALDIK